MYVSPINQISLESNSRRTISLVLTTTHVVNVRKQEALLSSLSYLAKNL